jgi:polyhydroxyalkanoate synthase subunit PhaC
VRLQKLHARQNLSNPEFEKMLCHEALRRTQRFVAGVRAYQTSPVYRNLPPAPVIWQNGTTCLRDYNPRNPDLPAVLVIPSLINRFDILDLDVDLSFLRFMATQGLRPLVVDWGVPGEEENSFSLDDYIMARLVPILDLITSNVGGQKEGKGKTYRGSESRIVSPGTKCHIIGYCMGGLLALALAGLRPTQSKSLSLIATPWDFHQPDANIGPTWITLAEQVEPCLQKLGYLPVDIIQSLFSAIQPLQALTKFAEFVDRSPQSPEVRRFVLVEDWLNNGVPLTALVTRDCFRGWYGENKPAAFQWRINGCVIDPRSIKIPSYIVVPGKDRIVPPESALPLAKLLPHVVLHEPMSGHIGLMASRQSERQVWMPLIHWLKRH